MVQDISSRRNSSVNALLSALGRGSGKEIETASRRVVRNVFRHLRREVAENRADPSAFATPEQLARRLVEVVARESRCPVSWTQHPEPLTREERRAILEEIAALFQPEIEELFEGMEAPPGTPLNNRR
jgi:hypothetical protein